MQKNREISSCTKAYEDSIKLNKWTWKSLVRINLIVISSTGKKKGSKLDSARLQHKLCMRNKVYHKYSGIQYMLKCT